MNEENKQYEEDKDKGVTIKDIPNLDEFDNVGFTGDYSPPPSTKWVNITIIGILVIFGIFASGMVILSHFEIIPFSLSDIGILLVVVGLSVYVVSLMLLAIWKVLETKWKKENPIRLEMSLIIDGQHADTEYIFFDNLAPLNNGFLLHIKPTPTGFVAGVSISKPTADLYKEEREEEPEEKE